MTTQSFPMPQAWNTGPAQDPAPELPGRAITVSFDGPWDGELQETVAEAIRWAATRAALARVEPNYIDHWDKQHPRPHCLGR